MKTEFDIPHFLNKFSEIPEEKWHMGEFISREDNSCRCALGHCGVSDIESMRTLEESVALIHILEFQSPYTGLEAVASVNDNNYYMISYNHLGKTPKQRIINRLKEIKDAIDTTGTGNKD